MYCVLHSTDAVVAWSFYIHIQLSIIITNNIARENADVFKTLQCFPHF